MEMIKLIAKYGVNVLTIINALIIALSEVWNWPWADKVSGTIIAITTVFSTYLLGQKALKKE